MASIVVEVKIESAVSLGAEAKVEVVRDARTEKQFKSRTLH